MEFDGRISQVYFFDAIRSGLIEIIELSYFCVATLFLSCICQKGPWNFLGCTNQVNFMRSPMRKNPSGLNV